MEDLGDLGMVSTLLQNGLSPLFRDSGLALTCVTVCAVPPQLCDDAEYGWFCKDSGFYRSCCRADQEDMGYCDRPRGLSVDPHFIVFLSVSYTS